MEPANKTVVTYFVIKGISDVPELQLLIFLLVLLIYLVILGGNMTIFLLISTDRHLHTPMYFFLANLTILDISCSTITLHKVLFTFITGDKLVSLAGCVMQMFFFLSFTCNELLILTAMGYDRYVAVCNPLRYHVVMNHKACCCLAGVCWVLGFLDIMPCALKVSSITCYTSREINHFFCDFVPVMKLSCSDTYDLQLYVIIEGVVLASFVPFSLTFISYVFIIRSILRIRSSNGRWKAFYTCSSHLTIIVLLYGTLSYQYFRPVEYIILGSYKLSSLFNAIGVPILNPLIYSLKNKDVHSALKRMLNKNSSQIKRE
ncbi:PREDICTED: olfactory receptor 1019-like [Nanorana parkeri]|uniref:olfactory receptor 1019-like n=1 Tax=Nanorana parkeri TaxID=125878 RepID=UPI000853F3A2|nr:PREDICTED: olfactory receptor 1019-like [Nanorana parkeri]